MSKTSGAQIVAVAAWLSLLAAPWYAMIAGRGLATPGLVGVVGVSAAVGFVASVYHQGAVVRQRRAADAVTEELKRAAVSRMTGGRRLEA